jgi:hypothetical protein
MPYRAKFFQALSGSSGSVTLSYELTQFTSSGTWTKPANCVGVEVFTFSSAGGGSSGSRQGTGVLSRGGCGGASGLCNAVFFEASDVSNTVTVTIGAGGSGGAGVTADSTTGNVGGSGGTTSFGSYTVLFGGGGAAAITAGIPNYYSTGPGQSPALYPITQGGASGRTSSGSGGAGNISNQQNTFTQGFPSAPDGGGINTSNTATNGGVGSQWLDTNNIFSTAAVAGTAGGGNGNPGTENTATLFGGGPIMLATANVGTIFAGNSGSGGGSGVTAAGGNAGTSARGQGGAGGGASRNGFTSGAGSAGGNGFIKVLAIIAS